MSQVDLYFYKMSDEVNKEAINKEFAQESQWCYVEGDESSVGTVQEFPSGRELSH